MFFAGPCPQPSLAEVSLPLPHLPKNQPKFWAGQDAKEAPRGLLTSGNFSPAHLFCVGEALSYLLLSAHHHAGPWGMGMREKEAQPTFCENADLMKGFGIIQTFEFTLKTT